MANRVDVDFGATIRGFVPKQQVFERFDLVRTLGRGGMGVVWLARDSKLERDVALKFLPEAVSLDPRSVDDLKRETTRSLDLTHPHIVRIYDFFEDEQAAAISMEYVDGGTLSKLAVDRPNRCFDPDDILPWLRQAVDALDYAHTRARIVHRDLKPANLMVTKSGDLKVTDFGISATVTDSVTRVSRVTSSGSTPAYASPQQVMGERATPADDIYSLGATCYDLLTGKPPFYTGNLLAQVQERTPPSIQERRAELEISGRPISKSWERAIAACLAKDPAQRPSSAEAMLALIEDRPAREVIVVPPRQPEEKKKDEQGGGGSVKIAKPGVFAAARKMLADVRTLGGFFAWLWALTRGLAGIVPQLLVIGLLLAGVSAGIAAFSRWGASPKQQVVSFPDAPPPGPGDQPGANTPQVATPSVTPASQVTANRASDPGPRPLASTPPVVATSQPLPAETPPSPRETAPAAPASTPSPYQEIPRVVAPPPPTTGFVEINSSPIRAAVFIDGNRLGETPLRIQDVPPGAIAATLKLAGHRDAAVNGVVRAGDTTWLDATLEPLPQRVEAPRGGFVVPELELAMLRMAPGEFLMGSSVAESGQGSDEQPQTRVRLSREFWIGRTEVTQGQYERIMGRNPSAAKSLGPNGPVERVSWDEAMQFCAQLTDRERSAGRLPQGYRFSLPTEAQWEYACRAGTTTPYAGELEQLGWVGSRAGGAPKAVAQKDPNAWGLYDMHGNVAEWTASFYDHTYPGGVQTDYAGPASGRVRVIRGGAFNSTAKNSRSAYRTYVTGIQRGDPSRGFRVALVPQR